MLKNQSFRPTTWIRDRVFAEKGQVLTVTQAIGERLVELGYAVKETKKPTPSSNKSFSPSKNKAYLGEKKKGGWYDVYDSNNLKVATLREKEAKDKLKELNANV